jgi:hypothetical protein
MLDLAGIYSSHRLQYILYICNEKVIQQIKARKKKAAQEKETPVENRGPWNTTFE